MNRLRIALDVREIYKPERRGMGKTLTDLYVTLAERRPDWRFHLIHQLPGSCREFDAIPAMTRSKLDLPGADRFKLWERAILPAAALSGLADVLHSPANTGPSRSLVPVVVTIHDLIPLDLAPHLPQTQSWLRRVKAAARSARHITTPSEYSKQRIVEALGIRPEKITVNPWAPHRGLQHIDDPATRLKYGVQPNEPYLFAFGAADPRKNTRGLLQAYARLPERLRKEVRLVVVGITASVLSEFRNFAASLGLEDRTCLHSFTPDEDIPALLSGATALAFPSRCEGFGLPILDAFACRTAVLTANNTSLPEVAGDAAVLVDAECVDSIRDGLEQILSSESHRAELVRRGTERLVFYNWDRAAETIASVFERAVIGRYAS